MDKWGELLFTKETNRIRDCVNNGQCPTCSEEIGEVVKLVDTRIGKGHYRILGCESCRKLYLYWRQ